MAAPPNFFIGRIFLSGYVVLPQGIVERSLLVGTFFPLPDDQGARHTEPTGRVLFFE